MALAALILALVAGVWAGLEKDWRTVILAVAVVLVVLAQNPTIHV